MNTEGLVGQFLKGSLKNGQKFFGRCISVDDNFIVLTGDPESVSAKKVVNIDQITEFYVEPFLEGGKND